MKAPASSCALVVALALQTTLSGLTMAGRRGEPRAGGGGYAALAFGPVPGLVAGTAGGLIQDALAGGIVGVGGLSKTLVGFLVGLLGAQFIVAQPLPRFVMFVGATVIHELCYQALYALVESGRSGCAGGDADAGGDQRLVGVLAFYIVESAPE